MVEAAPGSGLETGKTRTTERDSSMGEEQGGLDLPQHEHRSEDSQVCEPYVTVPRAWEKSGADELGCPE